MRQEDRQSIQAREFRGYALDFAARLEAAEPHLILKVLHASNICRQTFFLASVEIDLDRPELFLARVAERAPDILVHVDHLDPHAQVARALILLKPRRLVESLYGCCPDGFLGLIARLGHSPLYGNETYRLAFELYADARHRRRAKVLGQLAGQVTPEHVIVAAGLDDVLVHRSVVARARASEVEALNTFAAMITDLCAATPETIRESLDALPVAGRGARITEWAQGWLGRQVRTPFEPPIPATDPDLKLRLGADLISLGRRFRNCASQRQSYSFVGERLIYEWTRPGEAAVLELLRLTSGTKTYWVCEDLLAPRNRRVKPALADAIRAKLDQHDILYQSLVPLPAGEQALHKLLNHHVRPAWDEHLDVDGGEAVEDDADLDRMLCELEREVHGQEAA